MNHSTVPSMLGSQPAAAASWPNVVAYESMSKSFIWFHELLIGALLPFSIFPCCLRCIFELCPQGFTDIGNEVSTCGVEASTVQVGSLEH